MGRTPSDGWSDERVEELKKLWAQGLSASQVAKQLGGVTRNAALGKLSRLGLLGRPTPSKPTKLRAPAVKRAPHQNAGLAFRTRKFEAPKTNNLVGVNAERRAVAEDPGLALPASAALPGSSPKPWLQRASGECAWPIGDGVGPDLLHCCNPVHARGWCEAHLARGVQKLKPGQPRTGNELSRSLRRFVAA